MRIMNKYMCIHEVVAADAAAEIYRMTAEMLATTETIIDDPFAKLESDGDDLETNELVIEGTD